MFKLLVRGACLVTLIAGLMNIPVQAQAPAKPKFVGVVAEGERFKPEDSKGWKPTSQDDSYASHTYGGMWSTHGGLAGAPADSVGSVATQSVRIPEAGAYKVWSKYQAPPYFNYLHKIEVVQNGKTVFTQDFGKIGTPRIFSFNTPSTELWWYWGVDHDAIESSTQTVTLAAGDAQVRLVTVASPAPAGDRFIDFVFLTTAPDYQPTGPIGSLWAMDAMLANQLYMRFQNVSPEPAQLEINRGGHYQPANYAGGTAKYPEQPVAAGQWSAWYNVGPFCVLVHNEGLKLDLPKGGTIPVQFARDPQGQDLVGDMKVASGETVNVPIDITWNTKARVRPSRELGQEITALSKKWRTANGGKKPQEIAYYGGFSYNKTDWISAMKDAIGYNTGLPDSYPQLKVQGYHQHAHNPAEIETYAKTLSPEQKANMRVLSFGDEIDIGHINFQDPALQPKFVEWLKARKITKADLGLEPDQAKLTDRDTNARVGWYANAFSDQQQFAQYRAMTDLARQLIGPQVQTGANYSPHGQPQYYGHLNQWVDIFKANAVSMYWAEDYIFSVPQVPQMVSWMLATMHCATKYNNQIIHFYVMPHAPGQIPEFLRRSMVFAVGSGAAHIDNFWVAPQEHFTENYVAWGYDDMFRVLHESIYDAGEVEKISRHGKLRNGRVAVVLSRATDFNEGRLMIESAKDPFMAMSANALKPPKPGEAAKSNQMICRLDQQMLYLALHHSQNKPDLITEEDIHDLDILKNYDVVYFAGEWIDHRAVQKLDPWVQNGGVLYASAGLGHKNEFDEADPGLFKILGLKDAKLSKNAIVIRPLLELPLSKPIGTITMEGQKIPAIGMKQVLTPDKAKVLGTWDDGGAAVTVNEYGKGKAFAVGTLAGTSYMKTGLKPIPYARGGRHTVYNPVDFDPAATKLARLGVDARKPAQEVICSIDLVESAVIDSDQGTLLTLVNWTNAPLKGLEVKIKMPAAPKSARSIEGQKDLPVSYANGMASFKIDLNEADFVVLGK